MLLELREQFNFCLQIRMSAPLVPRVIAVPVQIQTVVSLVIALAQGTKETHVKQVKRFEQHNFTLTLKHIRESKFASSLNKLNS